VVREGDDMKTMPEMPELLRRAQVLEILGVGRRTLEKMAESRTLRPVNIPGMRWRFFRKEDVFRLTSST